jgi:hypothetical protein
VCACADWRLTTSSTTEEKKGKSKSKKGRKGKEGGEEEEEMLSWEDFVTVMSMPTEEEDIKTVWRILDSEKKGTHPCTQRLVRAHVRVRWCVCGWDSRGGVQVRYRWWTCRR